MSLNRGKRGSFGENDKEKPRERERPKVVRRFRARFELRALKAKDRTEADGSIAMADRLKSGKRTGLVIGGGGPQGGLSCDPAVAWAYHVRRMLRPIRVAPCTITDAAGNSIAVVTVDSVTGRRTRTATSGVTTREVTSKP